MVETVQFKRGKEPESDKYVGPAGEITVVENDWSLRVHDGITPGGHKVGQDILEYAVKNYINHPFIKDAYQNYEAAKAELALRIKLLKDI